MGLFLTVCFAGMWICIGVALIELYHIHFAIP